MYRNAVPFTELIINEGFLESLEDLQTLCEAGSRVQNAEEDEGYRLSNKTDSNDYTELCNMKTMSGMSGDGRIIPNNTPYISRGYDHCNPFEEPTTEYQHSMEMKLEEDNLDYSLHQEGFLNSEQMESTKSNKSVRPTSPSTPCWPIRVACSSSHGTDAKRSNLRSSLLQDYQALRWSTMNGATTNRDTYNYEIYSTSFPDLSLSEANKENATSTYAGSNISRPVKRKRISETSALESNLDTCAQRFERAFRSSAESDGFAKGTISEMGNFLKDLPDVSPMKEDFKVQLLQTPLSSGQDKQEHEVCDIGFSKETSAPMEYSQTPSRVLRKIPTKLFGYHNKQKEDLDESICALNYSLISDESFDKTNDQVFLDAENLHTPKVDERSLAFHSTTVQRRLSEEYMPEEGSFNDTLNYDNVQTPTIPTEASASITSTARRRRRRKPFSIKKRHKVEPVPTILILKDYFNQAYDLNVSEEALIKATENALTLEGIQEANEARNIYLGKSDLSKTGKTNFINLGLDYRIQALYKSSYPPRYALLNELFVCNTCFQYFASSEGLSRHMKKCISSRTPPGDEIYRDKKNFLSVFLVRGDKEPIYCSNISLMTMFWLRDKVVYLDVEPFTYFVVARPNAQGNFIPLGYFSKQRENGENHNLCCFCVFPCFQKQGLGRFIIDFSYAISRLENNPGGPERPFSILGEMAYKSYWYETLIQIAADIIRNKMDNKISSIVRRTGMQESDIVATLLEMFPDNKQKKKRTLVLPMAGESFIFESAEEISAKREQLRIHDEYFAPAFMKSVRTF